MTSSIHSTECEVGGHRLTIETGRLAKQASGSALLCYGDTVVLSTAVASKNVREGIDFLPLTVEFEERQYAAGKIPGGFLRREGRPTEAAVLAGRQVDRPIRPLLPKEWRREIQVINTVMAVDHENNPDVMAVIGSSIALGLSEVPFDGPVSAVHVGHIDGRFVINPTFEQMKNSILDLVVVSTDKAVVMIEAGAKETSEDITFEAIKLGHEANQAVIECQKKLIRQAGKAKEEMPSFEPSAELNASLVDIDENRINEIMSHTDKAEREAALSSLKKEMSTELDAFDPSEVEPPIDKKVKMAIRKYILEKKRRPGGRALDEIRPLSCAVGLLPRVHGSSLFSRGETQVMSITTLGSLRQEQQLDSIGVEDKKRFMHHYNFPPYSVGEVRRVGSPGRREIGHGALAERAVLPMLPGEEDFFPYTIRVVSEVLGSNGSTSMASTCATSLSLMDAGVPLKKPVAGISIGLITGDGDEFVTLTDIEGIEDHYGDMDFKVAGTADGVTAVQLDIKLKGISMAVIEQALKQAKEARMVILGKMAEAISTSRSELNPYAPRMYRLSIDPEKIGTVIGPGGKMIRQITEETGATVDIENDGSVFVGSNDEASAKKAIKMIEDLTREVAVGDTYAGKVVRIMGFGAFVELMPGKDGLVHISELAAHRVDKVEDIVKIGDEVTVKVIEIDNQGRVNLSMRELIEGQEPRPKEPRPPRRDFPRRDSRPHPSGDRPRR